MDQFYKGEGIAGRLNKVETFKFNGIRELSNLAERTCKKMGLESSDYFSGTRIIAFGSHVGGLLPGPDSDIDLIIVGCDPNMDNKLIRLITAEIETECDIHYFRYSADQPKPANLGILAGIEMGRRVIGKGPRIELSDGDWENICLYACLSQGERGRPDLSRSPGIKYEFGSTRTQQAIRYLYMHHLRSQGINASRLSQDPSRAIRKMTKYGFIDLNQAVSLFKGIADLASNPEPSLMAANWRDVSSVFESLQQRFFANIGVGKDILYSYPKMSVNDRITFTKIDEKHAMISAWLDTDPAVLDQVLDNFSMSWASCLGVAMSRFATVQLIEKVRGINDVMWKDDYLSRMANANLVKLSNRGVY